jgi:hypothetical protein
MIYLFRGIHVNTVFDQILNTSCFRGDQKIDCMHVCTICQLSGTTELYFSNGEGGEVLGLEHDRNGGATIQRSIAIATPKMGSFILWLTTGLDQNVEIIESGAGTRSAAHSASVAGA